jgi:hypothetical protein
MPLETAYYIGSDPKAKAQEAGATIRRHWEVESTTTTTTTTA